MRDRRARGRSRRLHSQTGGAEAAGRTSQGAARAIATQSGVDCPLFQSELVGRLSRAAPIDRDYLDRVVHLGCLDEPDGVGPAGNRLPQSTSVGVYLVV